MPTSVAGVLIILIAIFPGLIGNWIYRVFVGVDWRQKDWQAVLRLLGFSTIGVTLYGLVARWSGWPPPAHLFPATYQDLAPDFRALELVFLPYAGHVIGGTAAGLLAAGGARLLMRFSSASLYPSAWDDFVRTYAPNHWVIVGLSSGDVYAGKLKTVDVAVATDERDIVLSEPAVYDRETGKYTSINYQYIFIPANSLYSIAAIYDAGKDERTVPVGELLFATGESDDGQEDDGTAARSTRAPG